MRDHRKAEVVNEITTLAKRYAGTQQLHERMSGALLQYLAEQDRDTRYACANAVQELPHGTDCRIDNGDAHRACINARAF